MVVAGGETATGRNVVMTSLGGQVSGTMRDADGGEVAGHVTVYRRGSTGAFTAFAETETAVGTGRWIVDGLSAGNYRIEFDPDAATLAGEFWRDAATLATATTVTVTAGQQVGSIDPVLDPVRSPSPG